jgi:hypothetical protein
MNARRVKQSFSLHLHGTPEQVFPLLCPVREYEWIESWACFVVYSLSGVAELDCVFKTNFPPDGPEDTWVVSRYEPPTLIEFVRVNPLRSLRYSLVLKGNEDGTSTLEWSTTYTSLGPGGDELLESLTDESFRAKMEMRQRQLNHYLATGQMLSETARP